MNTIKKSLIAILLLLSTIACNAQIKNTKIDTVKIYGNCDMCKKTIETAGNIKKTAIVNWHENTQMATLTYDTKKTNQDEILKRIALAGYDSDKFLAPDDVYAQLPACCQYERVKKAMVKIEEPKVETKHESHTKNTIITENQGINQLKAIFDSYFAIKDALVKTDANTAAIKAKDLLTAINLVKMETLQPEEHVVWMKVMKNLSLNAEDISKTTEISKQRNYFMLLSKNMYALLKASKSETSIYYQHCPMANEGKGANWLSKESPIKNPYYGVQMLNCGQTVEIIK